ncbi:PREDICTED: uncharacterized protein LOC108568696 [Nicrophorus vespilloides]|uniref:Uncharacterized protein LOC108568696 n=1 Tax=Nicrophorus vespilloides TaxID=110193 RepID=A0ABM1NF16_NICVS|nr:PREDICTED: uncharacterized protein LOC108568696 [Nicrophorus vespilloides]
MSPKMQVPQLSAVALCNVSTLLMQCLSDDEGANYEAVATYLLDATHEVLQDLLKLILNVKNLDASTRFSCLQMILREDIQRLDTGLFPHSYYEKILEVIAASGRGLKHLNLKGIWLRDYPESLRDLISKLSNLKVLVIPHMADDQVLEALIESCPQLSVLDISGECNFTADGLRNVKSNRLKVLSVGMYGKRTVTDDDATEYVRTIVQMLKNLPNLNVLKTYSHTGLALLEMYKENPDCRTNLKYIHDTSTSIEVLEAVVKLCPELESVNLNSPKERVLSGLSSLKRLSSLKISEPDCSELMEYLEVAGRKIQVLKLSTTRGESLDVSRLAVLAPDLLTLELYKSRLICMHPDNYFLSLQTLEVLYCDISTVVLRYLLQNSPFLKRVIIGDDIHMTDGDVFRICAECEFYALEELWFSRARSLTATSIELLMGHCPNLKVLGQVSGWDISSDDLDLLRTIITSANIDLTLLPIE